MTIKAERECKAREYCINGILWPDRDCGVTVQRLRHDLSDVCRFSNYRDMTCKLRDNRMERSRESKEVVKWSWCGSPFGEAGSNEMECVRMKVKNRYYKDALRGEEVKDATTKK